jgi:hypothetical protein
MNASLLRKTVLWKDGTTTHIAPVIAQIGQVLMLRGGHIAMQEEVALFGVCPQCGETRQQWDWVKGEPAAACCDT